MATLEKAYNEFLYTAKDARRVFDEHGTPGLMMYFTPGQLRVMLTKGDLQKLFNKEELWVLDMEDLIENKAESPPSSLGSLFVGSSQESGSSSSGASGDTQAQRVRKEIEAWERANRDEDRDEEMHAAVDVDVNAVGEQEDPGIPRQNGQGMAVTSPAPAPTRGIGHEGEMDEWERRERKEHRSLYGPANHEPVSWEGSMFGDVMIDLEEAAMTLFVLPSKDPVMGQ